MSSLVPHLAVIALATACSKPDEARDYGDRSRSLEASLHLNMLGKTASRYVGEHGKFVIGKAATLPPAPCCAGPNHKCPVTTAWATDPIWQALELEIDEPSRFQYSYESKDGSTFTATATGDVSCTGTPVTYTLTGTMEAGGPKVTLVEPPK